MAKVRIRIDNPRDGGFFYWLLKYLVFAVTGMALMVAHVLVGMYIYFARTVPQVPDLSTYAQRAPGITSIYAGDGSLLAELANERREVVPLDRIPQPLIDAVLATEDRRFYEHSGLHLRGFVRAVRENLRRGQIRQGGSTITQQVAKSFLSPERSFTRKLREAILARRLEARYGKREILALYLNHIFLGHGSYGVQAAARRYFDRDVWDLGLPELALLAGLAKAPTRYSPLDRPLAAQQRRDTVLRLMVEVGYLKPEIAQGIYGQPLRLKPRRDASRDTAPYFVDQVRRELTARFGQQAVFEGGLRVETTVQPVMDVLAAENVDHAVRQLDKRQGYRGPEARLDPDAQRLFQARAEIRYAGPLKENTLYLGLVTAVRSGGATVQVGPHTLELPLINMLWAAKYNPRDSNNDHFITSAYEALKPGDVIWVKPAFRSTLPRFSEFVYVPLTPKDAGQAGGSTEAVAQAAAGGAATTHASSTHAVAAAAPKATVPPAPTVAMAAAPGSPRTPGAPPAAVKPGSRPPRPSSSSGSGSGSSSTSGSRSGSRGLRGAKSTGSRSSGSRTPPTKPLLATKPATPPRPVAPKPPVDQPLQSGLRYVPGTGVQVVINGRSVEIAAKPPAPGKRVEVGEVAWLPEQAVPRKPTPAALREVLLEQPPRPQGAIYTVDMQTGYVLSMVGGNDYDRSEFNRVVQACRQPGSAYKPVYYSLALDRGYGFDTYWNDRVKMEIDPVTGEEWIPQNIDGSYTQQVSLERALVWSKNPPAIEVFKTLGKKDVAAWARRLGMTTPIHADDALALGASCVRIDELSRSFSLFGRNGRPLDSVTVKRVLSRSGEVMYDSSAWDDPLLDGASRLDRLVAMAGRTRRPVIAPRTAYLTGTLLRRVVAQGHSGAIRATKIIAAGKTGTSSRTSDVWFVGFTSRWLTTVWVGDDTYERQLGYTDASFTISVPMWARYMYAANRDTPLVELPVDRPASVKPTDRGGPLLPGFPLPPSAMPVDGSGNPIDPRVPVGGPVGAGRQPGAAVKPGTVVPRPPVAPGKPGSAPLVPGQRPQRLPSRREPPREPVIF